MTAAAARMDTGREREFELGDAEFETIRRLVGERTGIVLSDAKRDMVYGRLARRLRALGLRSFSDYLARLLDGDAEEMVAFTNALTTNLTAFFREPHHFEYLQQTLLPALMQHKQGNRRLRIWSAGCSTGEEPYSIAMVVRETVPEDWDVKILATDLDSDVVRHAREGIYRAERVEGLSRERLRRWVRRGKGDKAGLVRMAPALRQLITFKTLNLMESWPMRGPFDFIFCRNVVIYFSKDTQRVLFDRFADLLPADGHLFIGHSESLHRVTDRFRLLGQTIYRKVK